jgi:hypothetical protein
VSDVAAVIARIEQARALLGPSKVRLHHVPRWFAKSRIISESGIWQGSWLDHFGSTTLADGRAAFVSEPYHVTAAELAECQEIAARVGCDFWVSANSWWYPGVTIRLVFAKKP